MMNKMSVNPKNDWICLTVFGSGHSEIILNPPGFIWMPVEEIMKPKYSTLDLSNLNFLALVNSCAACSCSKTCVTNAL